MFHVKRLAENLTNLHMSFRFKRVGSRGQVVILPIGDQSIVAKVALLRVAENVMPISFVPNGRLSNLWSLSATAYMFDEDFAIAELCAST